MIHGEDFKSVGIGEGFWGICYMLCVSCHARASYSLFEQATFASLLSPSEEDSVISFTGKFPPGKVEYNK